MDNLLQPQKSRIVITKPRQGLTTQSGQRVSLPQPPRLWKPVLLVPWPCPRCERLEPFHLCAYLYREVQRICRK